MRARGWIGVIAAVILAFLLFSLGVQIGGRNYGPGWFGSGMMGGYATGMGRYGYGMGPWMMGVNGFTYGSGPLMMAPYGAGQPGLNLSAEDVKTRFERWLAVQGNPRVKLGNVAAKDSDTITVDVVTTDKDGLVQRFAVNRHSGFAQISTE